jgi:hypothetical protein
MFVIRVAALTHDVPEQEVAEEFWANLLKKGDKDEIESRLFRRA